MEQQIAARQAQHSAAVLSAMIAVQKIAPRALAVVALQRQQSGAPALGGHSRALRCHALPLIVG